MVKIDVEGMELSVLRSARGVIERDRPLLYFEVAVEQMARFGINRGDVEAFLRAYDDRFFRNVGERNSTNDAFPLAELQSHSEGGAFFDVLAVPRDSARVARAEEAVAAAATGGDPIAPSRAFFRELFGLAGMRATPLTV